MQVSAEILENGRMFGRDCGKVVEGFVRAGSKARRSHIVAQDAAIDDLREKGGLGNHLAHQVRYVFLALRREGFLIARAPTKSDDDYFSPLHGGASQGDGRVEQRASQRYACGGTQEVAPGESQLPGEFHRAGSLIVHRSPKRNRYRLPAETRV